MYRHSPLLYMLQRRNDRNNTTAAALLSSLLQRQQRNVDRRPRMSECRRNIYHHSATTAEYQNFAHHALTIESSQHHAPPPPPPPQQQQHQSKLVFGHTFTPHMLQIHYQNAQWSAPKIVPYQNLCVSPAASSLHYGLQCFEGMKAYKPLQQPQQPSLESNAPTTNEIRLFRPDKNMQRLSHSMERLSMPGYQFDAQELIQCISTLVRLDEAYIPVSTTPGYALYLRPTVIATHPYLGLCPPEQLLLYVICSPVGPYYNTHSQFAPIRLMTSANDAVRAWPGGTGCHKVGGNYAGTMSAQQHAQRNGCEQVLWLLDDAITEVGSMNVFFVMKKKNTNDDEDNNHVEFITPPLARGDILPGVTRDSILQLARTEWKETVTVSERDITMTQVVDAIQTGQLLEVFGAGTAAVVTSVQSIHHMGIDYPIHPTRDANTTNHHHETSWTKRVWDRLTAIQYGTQEGPPGWSVVI